jgi:3-keto-disaccharide hydrolase
MKTHCILILIAAIAVRVAVAGEPNTLTSEEKAAGWKLLFDGKTTKGWRGIDKDEFPKSGWAADDGTLHHTKGGGDIVTTDKFGDFDLQFDWKISPAGNSGVKYLIKEKRDGGAGNVGHEYQVLDDAKASDGVKPTHRSAALYDVIVPKDAKLKPVGEWNTGRILIQGKHVEHWLNGAKTVDYELESDELKKLVAESKFKSLAYYVTKFKTPILLQDHGDEAWFRSIKIRELPAK